MWPNRRTYVQYGPVRGHFPTDRLDR
jgi:hypothetical protein